jgi:NAD(P)-dependent dehydrogenase (short-subunit alcohol dehydrogenase family)
MALANPPPYGTRMLPENTYRGAVVMITGAGTGLGKAMALEFARLGAAIAVVSRKPQHLQSGVDAIEEIGGKAASFACDIRDPERIAATFDEIEANLGPVTVLVNNAAGNFPAPAEDMTPNAWRSVTQIVLDGTFFCCTEFARRRLALAEAGGEGGGAILNIGATYSWTGGPGTSHSAAAKAGVTNLTQSLSVEWAPDNIRVNCLAPGLFIHDDHPVALSQGIKGGAGRDYANADNTVPGGRTGFLHELGWAATYLCSPFAAYITGHTLVIDGANWLRRGLRMPEFTPVRDTIARRNS